MADYQDRLQSLMTEFYDAWQKDENKGKGKWELLGDFSEAHQIAVTLGNFNYQVENGGIEQWIYNGYFHDDAEKLTEYLEAGAVSDDRCQVILDRVNILIQYAADTECDRYGSYYEQDGDAAFIGDMMDCGKFDTWYYDRCGNEDWWKTVSGIVDKADGREWASTDLETPVSEQAADIAPATQVSAKRSPLQVYIENADKPHIGGFTIPLPTTKETLALWLAAIEADGNNPESIVVREIRSPMEELSKALGHGSYPLDELNYLAAKIDGIGEYDKESFLAALERRQYSRDIATIINLTENITKFDLQPAFSVEQYGDFLLESAKDISGPAFERLEQSSDEDDRALAAHILKIESLVDPRAYGKTVVQEEQGDFTNYGYLTLRGEFQEVYHGQEDIPKEYRLFAREDSPLIEAGTDITATRPAGKESVLAKIREAKAAAKNAPTPEKKDRGEKSYEPEV